ncbi:MAG: hypothetical protein JWM34_3221 [Ilumatobacteraceae bacterium]|nr:hypothetical protein [Ilumatobacteraceae bacterium]
MPNLAPKKLPNSLSHLVWTFKRRPVADVGDADKLSIRRPSQQMRIDLVSDMTARDWVELTPDRDLVE